MAHIARTRIRHILLLLAVLVAIMPLMAGHPWRSAVGASSVVPGRALADIALGSPIGEVLTRFGTPSAVRLTGSDGLLGYGFDRYGITVYAHGDIVQAVATTNSVLGGINGISLGSPLSEVVRAMGADYAPAVIEGFPGIVYRGLGVAFGLDHDAVASILVFRAIAAAPAPAGSPTQPSGPVTSVDLAKSAATAGVATAAPTSGASPTLPDISRLKPYSAATHYLSLAGYMRLVVHGSSNTWITREQGERLMQQTYLPEIPVVR
jgi:hypothetical protein